MPLVFSGRRANPKILLRGLGTGRIPSNCLNIIKLALNRISSSSSKRSTMWGNAVSHVPVHLPLYAPSMVDWSPKKPSKQSHPNICLSTSISSQISPNLLKIYPSNQTSGRSLSLKRNMKQKKIDLKGWELSSVKISSQKLENVECLWLDQVPSVASYWRTTPWLTWRRAPKKEKVRLLSLTQIILKHPTLIDSFYSERSTCKSPRAQQQQLLWNKWTSSFKEKLRSELSW